MFLVLALLSNSVLPVAHAQSNTPLYLPIITNGNAPPQTDLVFRTHIQIQTPAQWRDLQRMEVVILEQGADWATVLVDDLQLTDLARWRFSPVDTDTLEALVAANTAIDNATATSFQPLLGEIAATKTRLQVDAAATTDARATLRAALQDLSSEQQTFLLAATSVDTDGDGLNDTREGYWCTDPARADSDFDGATDGTEVQRLKDWMDNKLSKAPSTAKPFQGWPPQKTNCYDDDLDSVPDVVEVLELGLDLNQESTDRDKFDDGQELFGTTYCPGSGGFCGYGVRPRNEDWGTITAQMPSWVKAPGHHPLVAAYPVPEVDVVESSLKVGLATEITDGTTTLSGVERSYSTSKTEGTSSGVANTTTWNEWQEVSVTQPINALSANTFTVQAASTNVGPLLAALAFVGTETAGAVVTEPVNCLFDELAGELSRCSKMYDRRAELKDSFVAAAKNTVYDPDQSIWKNTLKVGKCVISGPGACATQLGIGFLKQNNQRIRQRQTEDIDSSANRGSSGNTLVYQESSNTINVQPMFELSVPAPSYPPTQTDTKGKSWGGSQTVTTERYEEHTVTNGEAFLNQESWSKTTAINSAHAADFWFTYKVRNTGTEYAREIANLAFNIYIGDTPNPTYTYFVAPDIGGSGKFQNFMPIEEHQYTSRRIPLSLEEMKAIDLGEPVRIVVEDFSYGIDELFYQDAANAGLLIALEDGMGDGDDLIDTYLIPTWGQETVLNVVTRYFPHETDSSGIITAIWTPEYRSDIPDWCQSPRRPTDQPTKAVWCKHILSTADWWNIYTDGLGDGSEGWQNTQAVPGSIALFRFNKDSDIDGFSDRSEFQLGTDPNDASSFPRPELLAGLHNLRSGNRVTSTLSLLNSGIYDAYGVEAVMVAPDDSVSITNNTVGGSGRVRALKQVIVGSSLKLQTPLPAAWTQANHATLGVGGYYTGPQDRTYTFTVTGCPNGGCTVGSGSWKLDWSDGRGASGQLDFGTNYKSPTFLPVGTLGLTLALYSGNVANGESFTVNARTPRDTFQYTINRQPYTEPLVIVSYNDPQGNHRFVLPSAAMTLTTPTANLQQFAGTMLDDVGVEIVTSRPFTVGINSATLLVNNPSAKTLQNARLFLEVINISGTVVSEVPTQVNLPPGPTAVPVTFNTGSFNPAYRAADDYIVMAFLTDYQGNILDTAGRPLSSFQVDPLPTLAADDTTLSWNIGTVTQGTLLKHPLALANTGFGRLYTYIPPTSGLALNTVGSRTIGAADQPLYELTLRTAGLPVGAYDQTITLATSDPAHPTRSLRVYGTVTAASGDTSGGVLQRPLDFAVNVPGSHSQGEWVDFTHDLGPNPQNLHPVKVYSQDYGTLYGVGKYATAFGQGFGTGRDGDLVVNNGETITLNTTRVSVNAAGTDAIPANSAGFTVGDLVLFHQTQGTANIGRWEFNTITTINSATSWTLAKPLRYAYDNVNGRAQVIKLPQYRNITVQAGGTLIGPAWDGATGGILAFLASGTAVIYGTVTTGGPGPGGGYSIIPTGYRGHPAYTPTGGAGSLGYQGEGTGGGWSQSTAANLNGGGGGFTGNGQGGGGGGNGSAGATKSGAGGAISGSEDLTTMVFGGAGGSGGSNGSYSGGPGGYGGGIILINAANLDSANGYIQADGSDGQVGGTSGGGGGGGAGGSILIKTQNATISTNRIMARGGNGAPNFAGTGGNGGAGRIRLEYCNMLSGATNPPASTQKLDCYITDQAEAAPYTTARLNLPENFSNGRTYHVQFGHQLSFSASGEQAATLRVPAGLVANSSLDVLLSNADTGNLTLKLDIGNDGSWDWEATQNVTNAATFSSPDLSAAFNQYWTGRGSPTTGNIEIPVKLWLSKGATAFITNLQQLNLTASGSSAAIDPRPLDVSVVVTGNHTAGEWVQFTYTLEPASQSLHPVKVYSRDYNKLWGLGKYATPFAVFGEAIKEGLVGYWSFDDGTAIDSSEYNNNGTIYGGAATEIGVKGNALRLDGTNDYVIVPTSSSLTNMSQTTIAYWTKYYRLSSGPDNVSTTISNGEGPNNFFTYAGHTTIGHYLGGWGNARVVGIPIDATKPLNQQEFIFATFVASNTKMYGYKNGQKIAEGDRGGYGIATAQPWIFGAQVGNFPYYLLNGYLDEIRIYNRVLTDAEIAYLYDMVVNPHIADVNNVNQAHLRLPETINGSQLYKVQFGRKLDFATAGNQVTALRVPAGLYNSVQLDALVSGLPANATLSLDVGNDGATEWSSTVANNSTNASADLATAFTAYWRSQGSPTTGTLDVPIKVTTTQPGQVLLTNLQVSATGSRLRYVRLPVATYTNFLLDFTAGSGGTVALDLGDNGSIDWSASLDAPRQLTANLKDALNAYLTGKSGEVAVPVRFYLSPLHPITLNDYQATVASNLDLTASSITVGGGVTAATADSLLIDAGSTARVQATLSNGSSSASGPVTAAFFATATGWGDWYIGSAFVADIAASGNASVSIPWNTTGFSGTVPVKVVINPYRRVAETNYINNSKAITVTVNPPVLLPAAPTGLVATMAATNRITLTWTDASNNESGFKIERSLDGVNGWTPIATVGANVTTYASIGLACGKAYFYRVRATNSNGDSAFSNVATTLTRLCTPPIQPLTAIAATQLTVQWGDNNSNESGFKIERSLTGATPWSQIATVGANVTTYTHSGLQCGTPYYYRVRAYTGSNNSAYSAIVNATTTICPPAAPTLLAATAISATQISLSWQDNSSNESGIKVERSPDGVTGWTLLTTVGANVTGYADNGVACATPYHYRVRATNAGGDSPNSNVVNATTPACLPDLIFADGFESGNFSAWSGRPVGTNLRITATAALANSVQGLAAAITTNTGMYLTDQRPVAEPRYRARFYFDPNAILMTNGNAHFLFYGYQGTTSVVLRIEFRRFNDTYQLRAAALNDAPPTGAATWRTTSYVIISDAPHYLELDWQAATAPGANNGSLTFWIDGVQRPSLTGLDNDTRRIDIARLGPIGGLDTGTRGSYYFDAFESRRRTYIGPVGGSALAAELTTADETLTTTVGTVLATSALRATEATTLTADMAGLGVEVTFPALTTAEALTAQLLVTDTQTLPDGYRLLGEMVALEIQTATGGVQTDAMQPVTVTMNYRSETLSTAPILQQWKGASQQWEPVTVGAADQTLKAAVTSPSILALFVPEEVTVEPEQPVQDENSAATEEETQPATGGYFLYLPLVAE
jgi:hypothetical protein